MKEKSNNTNSRFKFVRLLALLCTLSCLLICSCADAFFGDPPGIENERTQQTEVGSGNPTDTVNGNLVVHFIDVGQGDSTLILCNEKAMLIDGGDKSASSTVYTYLKKHGITYLDYVVCTHADADHVGGLSGALEYAKVGTVYCPVEEYDSQAFRAFQTRVEAQGKTLICPAVDTTFSLGGAAVTVLAPRESYKDNNNTSIVLRIVYGETSFLFTGDAEHDSEQAMCDANVPLKSTVLKVGHHGSDTSTSIYFLRAVMPEYAVISCGKNNKYGHPTEQTLSRLSQAGVRVLRTDLQGDIVCTSDGKNVEFQVAKNESATTSPSEDTEPTITEYPYVGNLNTKKLHKPDCRYLPTQDNAIWFTSREEAIENGYQPCGVCKP